MEVTYKNIYNASTHVWYERAISEYITMALSPFISIFFIKKGVKPNTITLYMIICGTIAPILFASNNIYVQLLSSFLFLLWFTLDASDGEVARFTKTFSKHGRDLDFLSHVSCHSLFVMALWLHYAKNSEHLVLYSLILFGLLATELFYRISVIYEVYIDKREASGFVKNRLVFVIITNLLYFPNFVVLFPFLHCLSVLFSFDLTYVFFSFFILYILYNINVYVNMIRRFYRN